MKVSSTKHESLAIKHEVTVTQGPGGGFHSIRQFMQLKLPGLVWALAARKMDRSLSTTSGAAAILMDINSDGLMCSPLQLRQLWYPEIRKPLNHIQ